MKKVIIVGASSGIGRGLAKVLSEDNYKVGITGRRTELLVQLKNANPDAFLIKTFDAIDTKSSIERLEELTKELGGLDILIFNAGRGELNKTLDFEKEKNTIDLNVTGFTNILDWSFKYFEKQGFGHLVAISSVAGLRGSRNTPSYNASKSYQISYLEGLRQKAKRVKKDIFVTDIRPGFVDTAMAKGVGTFWVMPVEKVVKQIFHSIKRKRKVVYVTKRWGVIARLLKVLPKFIYDRM